MHLFVHEDLKGSLTRDFRGILIYEKNLKLKISCQKLPFLQRAVNSDKDLITLFCVQEEFLTVLTCASTGACITLYFGGVEAGVSDCDVASLVMYCIDAPQRIVTKSLYRAARASMTFIDSV
jgi:hypothetical protein